MLAHIGRERAIGDLDVHARQGLAVDACDDRVTRGLGFLCQRRGGRQGKDQAGENRVPRRHSRCFLSISTVAAERAARASLIKHIARFRTSSANR